MNTNDNTAKAVKVEQEQNRPPRLPIGQGGRTVRTGTARRGGVEGGGAEAKEQARAKWEEAHPEQAAQRKAKELAKAVMKAAKEQVKAIMAKVAA